MSNTVKIIVSVNLDLYDEYERRDLLDDVDVIVQCRDCKYSTEEGITTECYFCHLPRWNTNPMDASPVEPDGFCAWGKRREL